MQNLWKVEKEIDAGFATWSLDLHFSFSEIYKVINAYWLKLSKEDSVVWKKMDQMILDNEASWRRMMTWLRETRSRPRPGHLPSPTGGHVTGGVASSVSTGPVTRVTCGQHSDKWRREEPVLARVNRKATAAWCLWPASTSKYCSNSPADLHGMWYSPVRRTLLTLSKLYRCLVLPIFTSFSQVHDTKY